MEMIIFFKLTGECQRHETITCKVDVAFLLPLKVVSSPTLLLVYKQCSGSGMLHPLLFNPGSGHHPGYVTYIALTTYFLCNKILKFFVSPFNFFLYLFNFNNLQFCGIHGTQKKIRDGKIWILDPV